MTERAETVIREIIDRRLKVGGGECLISVRTVAKTAMDRLGYQYSHSKRRIMCQAVLQVLQEYDISFWGHTKRKMQVRNNDEIPLSLHIYQVRG